MDWMLYVLLFLVGIGIGLLLHSIMRRKPSLLRPMNTIVTLVLATGMILTSIGLLVASLMLFQLGFYLMIPSVGVYVTKLMVGRKNLL
ncbi:CHASE2 domain-containing sensor protein [Alkalibacillus filiformis]|uniref:CHASE2 domain-containing sensor protein n=1 Tax=Alkalibacillus filiformis TaxID=200990 RepID=A0ABU0DPL3_9BACI|nr:hypothetical protein [Alkalibacillus filiformis]MDQ0350246.1 CHASE2 domain-containing sensor protein [Alkalibacillus filiformis]